MKTTQVSSDSSSIDVPSLKDALGFEQSFPITVDLTGSDDLTVSIETLVQAGQNAAGNRVALVIKSNNIQGLLPSLQELGFQIIETNSTDNQIKGFLPIQRISGLADLHSSSSGGSGGVNSGNVLPAGTVEEQTTSVPESNNASVIPFDFSKLQAFTNGVKAGSYKKLSSNLSALLTGSNVFNSQTNSPLKVESALQTTTTGVAIEAIADTNSYQLLAELQTLGLQNASLFGRIISGVIPLSSLGQMANLSSLRFARPAYKPVTNKFDYLGTSPGPVTNTGSVTSQGDKAQRSDIARTTFSVNGAGVTIGVLSDSYNNLGGAASDVASGDLPTGVIVLDDFASGGSDEGRAMMQIIHDVAPGSTLAFHTAFEGLASFANGIINLAKPVASGGAGAKVIVDDVFYFAEPFFQDGIVTQAVEQVATTGVAYFSSAGNQARQSYESVFTAGQTAGDYTFHDFDPSGAVNVFQKITINNGEFVPILQWDQPFASASTTGAGSQNDLDMFLFDGDGNIIASSVDANVDGDPFEFLEVQGTGEVFLAIAKWNPGGGPNPSKIKFVDVGFNSTYQFATNSSTSFGHNQAPNGQGVAAAYYQDTPAFGTNPPEPEPFTSLGGTPILFDTAGNRLATPVIRNQPAITAPDGVDTTFFGFDSDGNGKPNFFGTSAAAPSAAGVAALMRQKVPGVTNTQIYNALKSTAVDMNTPGYDFLTGNGLIRADAAIAYILPSSTISIAKTTDGKEAGSVSSVFTLTRTGDLSSALTVNYTLAGTATPGVDYTNPGAGKATFLAGSSKATITLPTIDDLLSDPSETIITKITAPTGYTISGPDNATATILDNDGNSANNNLVGTSFADALAGVGGNDTLSGLGGNDTLDGGANNDTYLFDTDLVLGSDRVIDASGIDTLNFAATTTKTINLNLGSTVAQTVTAGNLTLALASATAFENVIGGSLNDNIIGNTLANSLDGGAGNDNLNGGAGNDNLTGGLGKDTLTGSTGLDTLTYNSLGDSLLSGFDVIQGYSGTGASLDSINAPGSIAAINLTASKGTATALTEAAIQAVLTATKFAANTAAAFKVTGQSGTFIALNNGVAGFQAASDAIIQLSGYNIAVATPVVVI